MLKPNKLQPNIVLSYLLVWWASNVIGIVLKLDLIWAKFVDYIIYTFLKKISSNVLIFIFVVIFKTKIKPLI